MDFIEESCLRLPSLIYKPGDEPDFNNVVQQHSKLNYINWVADVLGRGLFKKLEQSYLEPVIKMGRKPGLNFSGKIFHLLMQRRIITAGDELWFRFGSTPMRFSAREFFITTGMSFEKKETERQKKGNNIVRKQYSWAKGGKHTVSTLYDKLKKVSGYNREGIQDEMICPGAVIITEAVLIASTTKEKICTSRLLAASDFEEYSSLPWGAISYKILLGQIKRMTELTWSKTNYDVKGFVWAINLWALSSIPASPSWTVLNSFNQGSKNR